MSNTNEVKRVGAYLDVNGVIHKSRAEAELANAEQAIIDRVDERYPVDGFNHSGMMIDFLRCNPEIVAGYVKAYAKADKVIGKREHYEESRLAKEQQTAYEEKALESELQEYDI